METLPQHMSGRYRNTCRDVTATHVGTLGDMISEAFHAHKRREYEARLKEAKDARKKSSTAAESSECGLVTSGESNHFFKERK